ncbi:MAG: EXLDI protein [Rhodoglobus sp.]
MSDSDLPLFERAAELAGGMSTAVATGLQLYVAQQERERKQVEMSTIELEVQDGPVVTTKRFTGRQLIRYEMRGGMHVRLFRVYLTAKGQYAVYSRSDPNWSALSSPDEDNPVWEDPHTWNTAWWDSNERTLRVFSEINSMQGDLPPELIAAITNAQALPSVEDLDI